MRRSDREIRDFDEILEVMKKCDVCRIAMQGDVYKRQHYRLRKPALYRPV